jgi:hypothetical protein
VTRQAMTINIPATPNRIHSVRVKGLMGCPPLGREMASLFGLCKANAICTGDLT